MLVEIKVALNYLLSFLYDKLPRRRVNLFGEEIEKCLKQKQLSASNRNAANFSLSLTVNKLAKYVDPCLVQAAKESAMDLDEIVEQLPVYLKIFIFVGKVAFRQCSGSCDIQETAKKIKCKYCSSKGGLELDKEEDEDVLSSEDLTFIYNKSQISVDHAEVKNSFDNLNEAAKIADFYQYLLTINSAGSHEAKIPPPLNLSQTAPLLSNSKSSIKQQFSPQHLINSLATRTTSPSNASEQWPSPSSSSCSSTSSSSSSSTSSSSQQLQTFKSFNDESLSQPISPLSISNRLMSPLFSSDNIDGLDALNSKIDFIF